MILVSVIIPVRNNARGLEICLRALQNQTYPAEKFETIVVDNASSESLDALKALFPQVIWRYDDGPGSYSARNRGLADASGDIVAFTDSDCIPDPRWLEHGVAALESGRGTIIGGNILLQDPVGRDFNVYELIELVVSGIPDNNRRLVEVRGFTATGNMLTFRRNFTKWGNFDAALKSAGDRDWVTRSIKNGEKLVYVENAIIRHPRRDAFGPLLLKIRRHIGGRIGILKREGLSIRKVTAELLDFCIFDPRIYIIAVKLPHIKSTGMRLKFIGMSLVVSVIATSERIRVLLGGATSRG